MYGVINCDASLSCAGNGAFESTEGPADATKETDLAFLHQSAKTGLIFNGNRVQAKVPTDVLHCKQETRCRGKVRRAVYCLLCNFKAIHESRDCNRSGELGSEFGRKFARHLYPQTRV